MNDQVFSTFHVAFEWKEEKEDRLMFLINARRGSINYRHQDVSKEC